MKRQGGLLLIPVCVACTAIPISAEAQGDDRLYAGGVAGISTLSADGRSIVAASAAAVSLYKPENGPAINGFVGVHLHRFFSVQANYVGNENDLTLFSSIAAPAGGGFVEQARTSSQHAFVADGLLYFRGLESGIRPYLSTGIAVLHFKGSMPSRTAAQGLSASDEEIASTRLGLRVAVGIDLALTGAWSFRYSFSETISGNPVSEQLMPAGQRNLANFQNLFGVVRRF